MNVLFILAKPIFCGDMQMHKIMTNYDGCLRVSTLSACKSVHNGISLNVVNSTIDNVLDVTSVELTFVRHIWKFSFRVPINIFLSKMTSFCSDLKA